MSVVIETTVGDITVDLYLGEKPRTCLNFLKLCKMKYFNFCLFHEVQQNFIAQTGDPTGTGRGGESIYAMLYGEQAKYFDSELKPRLKHEKLGTISMVNNGSNGNGSQFFITLAENLSHLDDVHSAFGEVTEGLEVLVKINNAICDKDHRPYQDIRITHTVVLHDPYDDPENLGAPPSSPLPTKELLQSDYLAADEEYDDTKGKTIEQIEEEIKDKDAKARATILEMVGDIPDVDVKPPENVLFVCKLNPVTTSEDLEIIFSRFGSIKSCEVIKDKKTGKSLQYAFIEFEREEDCENAYFKMDNVLIDDRRIHVDFSQSVAKSKWQNDRENRKGSRAPKREVLVKDNAMKSGRYDLLFDSPKIFVEDKVPVKTIHHENESSHKKHKSPSRGSKRKFHEHHSSENEHKKSRSRSPSGYKERSTSSSPSRGSSRMYPEQYFYESKFKKPRSRSPSYYREHKSFSSRSSGSNRMSHEQHFYETKYKKSRSRSSSRRREHKSFPSPTRGSNRVSREQHFYESKYKKSRSRSPSRQREHDSFSSARSKHRRH